MKFMLMLTILTCLTFACMATATEQMDDWNGDATPLSGSMFPYPANYAVQYIPAMDYNLERVEFFAGASTFMDDDQYTVQIMGDFDGQPDGVPIASAVHPMLDSDPAMFQGTDFDEPVYMIADQVYWVIYFAMPWSPFSAAIEGDLYTTMSSGDQIHWDPSNDQTWMALFWGEPTGVAVEAVSFSEVKNLFQ